MNPIRRSGPRKAQGTIDEIVDEIVVKFLRYTEP